MLRCTIQGKAIPLAFQASHTCGNPFRPTMFLVSRLLTIRSLINRSPQTSEKCSRTRRITGCWPKRDIHDDPSVPKCHHGFHKLGRVYFAIFLLSPSAVHAS